VSLPNARVTARRLGIAVALMLITRVERRRARSSGESIMGMSRKDRKARRARMARRARNAAREIGAALLKVAEVVVAVVT
jgi:hypothetical protein